MKNFIETLAPGWFAAVMGTAVTSLGLRLLAERLGLPEAAAASLALHWIAIAAMCALTALLLARIALFPKKVLAVIAHPVEGSFFATFPIAMLVMAAEWNGRGIAPDAVAALWGTGVVLTFATSSLILFKLFSGENLRLGMLSPAHFIPAVGLVVIPVAGAGIAASAEGLMRELLFAVNLTGFGAGVFMYVGLLALSMARHYLGAPIEGRMTPTLWVHLAPLAVIPLSLLQLLHALGDPAAFRYGLFVASAFLGAAFWWLFMAAILTVRNALLGRLPFALSWWAFIFPVGALLVLALRVSALLDLQLLPVVAAGLAVLLCALWLAAAFGTLRGLLAGTIQPKPGAAPAH